MTRPELGTVRVKRLLEHSTGAHWYWQPGWGLQYSKDGGIGLLISDGVEGAVTGHDFALIETAQDLAHAHLDLSTALAEAQEALRLWWLLFNPEGVTPQSMGWYNAHFERAKALTRAALAQPQ